MGVLSQIEATIRHQRGHLFGWVPVGFGGGIGLYFALRFEPSAMLVSAIVVAAAALVVLGQRVAEGFGALMLFLTMVGLGFAVASWRTHSVQGPVLDFRYYGPVEGRVVGIDRSASDAVRITLDRVVLERTAPGDTPRRVRISLHGDPALGIAPQPGLRVMTTAHLSPPGGPVEPGGFDFQRHAWFLELGAVGYTRVPLLALDQAETTGWLRVFGLRMALSDRMRQALPGDVGGFAAAVTTGDRSGLSRDAIESMRAANTAHLLAISGLHMGLLSAFVLGCLRLGLALVPYTALNWPTRKIAAAGALLASAGYLALSGGNVATERAFVMVAVMLVALMLDRRAISLRAVAIAAMIVLALRPEALLSPGFQMSFAATTALVAVFNGLRDSGWKMRPAWLAPAGAVVLSSAVAGLATAPIGAAHFNTMAHYGLLANLLSVPVMGLVVVPSAVLALCLSPFGLAWLGLWPMGTGLRWILWVADWVAGLDGARGHVASPAPWVLPMLALGALFVILWQGRARWIGVLPVMAALALWQVTIRPAVLIAETGGLVGVMTDKGRALSKARGAGFVAQVWLENDGDPADQPTAAGRWVAGDGRVRRMSAGQVTVVHVNGKRAASEFRGCDANDIVVSSVALDHQGCTVLDPEALRDTGSVALVIDKSGIGFRTAHSVTGARLWTTWGTSRRTGRDPKRLAAVPLN